MSGNLADVAAIAQVVTGVVSIVVAAWALYVSIQQLKPLRDELARLRAEDKKRDTLRGEEPQDVRRLEGFDPRFTNWDWNRFLSLDGNSSTRLISRLSPTYSDFHGKLHQGFPDDTVVIVDLLYVPYLLQRGLIAPLSSKNDLELDELLERRAGLLGVRLEEPAGKLIRKLCVDADGTVGALPLWVNTHGRIIPESVPVREGRRLNQLATFEQLLDHEDAGRLLGDASIQSHYMIFEYLAHLAYRKSSLFRQVDQQSYTSDLLVSADERARLARATADLAVRLHFYTGTGGMFRDATGIQDLETHSEFRVEHAGDARAIRERAALWKPVFSSELLWRTLPQRNSTPVASLANETEFLPPFARHESAESSYLTALGGYGLALPRGAARDRSSQQAMRYAFLSNPLLLHPYVNDMLPPDGGDAEVDGFLSRYSRPRWPFWPEVEVALTDTLLALLLVLPRDSCDGQEPRTVWSRYADTLVEEEQVSALLAGFLERVQVVFDGNDGWRFDPRRS